jgi:hypothetical protein
MSHALSAVNNCYIQIKFPYTGGPWSRRQHVTKATDTSDSNLSIVKIIEWQKVTQPIGGGDL